MPQAVRVESSCCSPFSVCLLLPGAEQVGCVEVPPFHSADPPVALNAQWCKVFFIEKQLQVFPCLLDVVYFHRQDNPAPIPVIVEGIPTKGATDQD